MSKPSNVMPLAPRLFSLGHDRSAAGSQSGLVGNLGTHSHARRERTDEVLPPVGARTNEHGGAVDLAVVQHRERPLDRRPRVAGRTVAGRVVAVDGDVISLPRRRSRQTCCRESEECRSKERTMPRGAPSMQPPKD